MSRHCCCNSCAATNMLNIGSDRSPCVTNDAVLRYAGYVGEHCEVDASAVNAAVCGPQVNPGNQADGLTVKLLALTGCVLCRLRPFRAHRKDSAWCTLRHGNSSCRCTASMAASATTPAQLACALPDSRAATAARQGRMPPLAAQASFPTSFAAEGGEHLLNDIQHTAAA